MALALAGWPAAVRHQGPQPAHSGGAGVAGHQRIQMTVARSCLHTSLDTPGRQYVTALLPRWDRPASWRVANSSAGAGHGPKRGDLLLINPRALRSRCPAPAGRGWMAVHLYHRKSRVPGVGHLPRAQLAEQERDPGRPLAAFLVASRLLSAGAPDGKVAILLAMSVSEQMPLADVKNRLSEVVDRLEREHGRVVITKHGHPAAVVISVDDLESLEETLDILDGAALLADIRESLAELSTTDATVLSKEEALRLIPGQ